MKRFAALSLLMSAAASAGQLTLAVPEVSVLGLAAKRGGFYTEYLADRLTEAGARVTTAKAIEQLLGVERQRQLMGCNESSCIAEIASALGSDGVAFGQVADVDGKYQLNLKIISAHDGKSIATFAFRAADEEALLDALETAANSLSKQASETLGRELTPQRVSHASGSSVRKLAVVPAAVGLASAIAAGVFWGLSSGLYKSIPQPGGATTTPVSFATAQQSAQQGATFQTVGWVCAGVAVVGLAAGALMFFLGADSKAVASLFSPSPNGLSAHF